MKHPNRIKETRLAQGLTQAALIKATGIPKRTVIAHEAGDFQIDGDTVAKYAAALDCAPEDLAAPETPTAATDVAPGAGPGADGIQDIPWGKIHPSALNPRKHFDEDELDELADAVERVGVLENLVVRPHPDIAGAFEIVAGERRWRAVERLIRRDQDERAEESHNGTSDLTTWFGFEPDFPVPCRVKTLTDIEALRIATMENVQRKDLHPLEEGEAYRAMVAAGDSTETIGILIGKTRRHVQLRIALAEKLSEEAKDAFFDGGITLQFARALTSAPVDAQAGFVAMIEAGWYKDARALTDEIMADLAPIEHALFDTSKYDGSFVEDPDDPERIFFTDVQQFNRLQMAEVERRKAKLAKKFAFVDVCPAGADFDAGDYEPCADPEFSGVVVDILPGGAVKFREDLARIQSPLFDDTDPGANTGAETAPPVPVGVASAADGAHPAPTGGPAPCAPKNAPPKAPITKALVQLAKNRKSRVLQCAVAGDFAVALRLAVLGLMGGTSGVMINVGNKGHHNAVLDTAVAAMIDTHRDRFGPDVHPRDDAYDANWGALRIRRPVSGGWNGGLDHEAAVFRTLLDMDDDDVQDLFALLIASRAGTFFHDRAGERGDDQVPVLAARAAGADPSAHPDGRADADYLAKLDRQGLIDLARAAGFAEDIAAMNPDTGLTGMSCAMLREDIAREAAQTKYVPDLLRFATDADIEAEDARADQDRADAKRERRSPGPAEAAQ